MTAGVALGCYRDLHEAASVFVHPGEAILPDLRWRDFYLEKYDRWLKTRQHQLRLWEK